MNEAFSLMLLLLGAVLRKEFVIVAIELCGSRDVLEAV
jgi:hypothetical protein